MYRKKIWNAVFAVTLSASMSFAPSAVYAQENESAEEVTEAADEAAENVTDDAAENNTQEHEIVLSDEMITVDGAEITEDVNATVYTGAEIVYYKADQSAVYGAGSEEDAHSEEEASEHTVVTITQPGTYRVSGSLSKGQIAIDLGEDADENPEAVVTLILDQADITCTVAPCIVVYHAYECGSDEEETATKDVDTSAAGFRLILADDSENTMNGSYVAKIYKEGTTQEQIDAGEAKKQWKFDATIDSLVSFEIDGEEKENGKLLVNAENEGISSGLHMTINGGEITINASDDSINTNEDGVSVFTMNDGIVVCNSGMGAEGDGIDSNGWIVINGGTVLACANPTSMDSGVDSDMGIYLNGGTVLASGNMYDRVEGDSEQPYLVLNFNRTVEADQLLLLKNSDGEAVAAFSAMNAFTTMVYGSEAITDGDYTLYKVSSVTGDLTGGIYTNITAYQDEVQLAYTSNTMMGAGGFGGGQRPDGEAPEPPEGMEKPEDFEPDQMPDGEAPELPEGMEKPEDFEPGQMPDGEAPEPPEGMEKPEDFEPGQMPDGMSEELESNTVFTVNGISNIFAGITEMNE